MTTTQHTAEPCQHRHPCNPPGGSIWAPGPCESCGLPWETARTIIDFNQAREILTSQAAYYHDNHDGAQADCNHQPCTEIRSALQGPGGEVAI